MSFRLGGTDGVSIEAAKWITALRQLDHHVSTLAGSGVADRLLPGLAAGASTPPSLGELRDALDDFDLVVVENLASLPLNVAARDVLYVALEDRPALFRHHDLAWQRENLAHVAGPRDSARWRHVTINEVSQRELAERGVPATVMYNSFDCSPPLGRRQYTRQALSVGEQLLVTLPTRAIARKNVAGALALCEELNGILWILGPTEDGYDVELDLLLRQYDVAIRRRLPDGLTMADVYAATDLVVMPSTWEGFGNPVLESVTHRRPLALNHYPVAREIISFGFTFFELSNVATMRRFLENPDETLFETNLEIARQHFNIDSLPVQLEEIIQELTSSTCD